MAKPNKLKYRLRPVEFKGKQTHIICYHGDFAVLPTTVAVVNYFLLTEPSYFKFDRTVEIISYWDLREMVVSLKDKVVTHLKELQKKSWDKAKEADAKIAAETSLSHLDDSSLQPINIFTSSFLESPIIPILGYLEIPIQHGWIVPNENKYQKLRNKISHDPILQLKDMEIAKEFLQNSPTELTQYGIQLLSKAIAERSLCALYRKGLTNLVYKHQGNLYVLVTEGDLLDIPATAIWKSLTVVHGEEVYFTDNFIHLPADEQPTEVGKKWVADREKKAAESAAIKKAKKGRKDKRKQIQNEKVEKNSCPDGNAKAPVPSDSLNVQNKKAEKESGPDGMTDAPVPLDILNVQNKEVEKESGPDGMTDATVPPDILNGQTCVPDASKVPVAEPISIKWKLVFSQFLERYKYGGKGILFFPAMLEFMKSVGSYHFGVRITDIAQYDTPLALAIRADTESFTELLTETVIDFMIKKEFDAEEVIKKRLKLFIHDDMPGPKSVIFFSDFVKGKDLVWPYQLYNGKWVNTPSLDGRQVGLGYVSYIQKNHEEEKSWGGNFDESHLKVIDGQFIIDKPAVEEFNKDHACLDLNRLIKILQKHYTSKLAGPPAFFDVFQTDIMKLMPDPKKDPRLFKKFQKFLLNHLAFKAPLVFSTLIRELFVVCQSERMYGANGELEYGYLPLISAKPKKVKWLKHARNGTPYGDVYFHMFNAKNSHQSKQENIHDNTQRNTYQNKHESPQENTQENLQGNMHDNIHDNTQRNTHQNKHESPQENTQENLQGNTQDDPQRNTQQNRHGPFAGRDRFRKGDFWNCLQYSRFFIEHAFDHTKEKGQRVKNLIIIALMLVDRPVLARIVSELIWHMMKTVYDGPFYPVWRHFEKSEYDDNPEIIAQGEESESNKHERNAQVKEAENTSDAYVLPDQASSTSGNVRSKAVLGYRGLSIHQSDVDSLDEPQFLTDNVIAMCASHISSSLNCQDVRFIDASTALAVCHVSSVAHEVDLATCPLALFVVSDTHDVSLLDGGSHWSLLVLDAVSNPSHPRFVHHDSSSWNLNEDNAKKYAEAIRGLYPRFGNAPYYPGPTPKQTNGYDCGAYTLAVAKAIYTWYSRGKQLHTNWFADVKEQVSAESVSRLRGEMRQLIARLIEEYKKNKAGESAKDQ